jgi:hypothetical protein
LGVFKGDKRSFQKIETKITPLSKNPQLEPNPYLKYKKIKIDPFKNVLKPKPESS